MYDCKQKGKTSIYRDVLSFFSIVSPSCSLSSCPSLFPPDHQFMKVPPSLLASACLCDAIKHMAPHLHDKCVAELATLARLEQVC